MNDSKDTVVSSTQRVAMQRVAAVVAVILAFWLGLRIAGKGDAGGADTDAASANDHDHEGESGADQVWTCSMHPQIRMSEPGDCPICGMDLIPASEGADDETGPNRVVLSERAKAMTAVRVQPVVRSRPRSEIRLLGRVAYDENRLRTVTAWTAGRIDRLDVRTTGATVRRGQAVARIYSPEVYAALKELAVAEGQVAQLGAGTPAGAFAQRTVDAARERLTLLGVQPSEIEAASKDDKVARGVPVRAPFAGTVIARKVEQGEYVKAGQALFELADLSRVWVELEAYESDLPQLEVGQPVEVSLEALPGEVFTGEITFIDPVMDLTSRVTKVRVEVQNPDGRLKPGMFAEGQIAGDGAGREVAPVEGVVTVPSSAVLWTGLRSIVYVEVPGASRPTYELRTIEVGPRAGDVYPVMSGLAEGERVVVQGAFMLDADLQLRGGPSMMTRDPGAALDVAPVFDLRTEEAEALAPVVRAYVEAQAAFAADDLAGAKKALDALVVAVKRAEVGGETAKVEAWRSLSSNISGHARQGAEAEELAASRVAFEKVSHVLLDLLTRFGNPTDTSLRVAFCPMAFDAKGAAWVQRDGDVANPYYGAAMLRCGEFRARVEAGERLPASSPTSSGEATP